MSQRAGGPKDNSRFTALIMAGTRRGGDPLAAATQAVHKALAAVNGKPMLARVVETLQSSAAVGRIIICGIDASIAAPACPTAAVEFDTGGESPAASVLHAIDTLGLAVPILITTADHPLLTTQMVEEFCGASAALDADVSFGITDGNAVSATFPGVRRTHFRFRDGGFCGCNLYGLLSSAGLAAPRLWRRVEQHRKQPWRMVAMLGPGLLLRFLLNRVELGDIPRLVEKRFQLRAFPVRLSDPAAGFDVDNLEQLRAAEAYLRRSAAGER